VWDLADRDASRWIVPLGASGDPADPHHHDQLELWATGRLVAVPPQEDA
jgi:penicillin amidase